MPAGGDVGRGLTETAGGISWPLYDALMPTLPRVSPFPLLAGAAVVLSTMSARAAVLAEYDLTGAPGSLAAKATGAGLTASGISFTGSAGGQFTGIPGVLVVNAAAGSTSAAAAVAGRSFFQITLVPSAGHALKLGEFIFDGAGASVGSGWTVRSSVDGYAADLGGADFASVYPVFSPHSVDLSGAAFQGLRGEVSFRVYSYTPGSNPAGAYDNLRFDGDVLVVPEPATAVAVALGGLVLGGRRRRGLSAGSSSARGEAGQIR